MSNKESVRKRLLDARDKRGIDNKDWARMTGSRQQALEMIDTGAIDMSGEEFIEMVEALIDATLNEPLPKLMKFDEPLVIAFDIHKGGGGKTTLSCNISYELAKRGYRVLMIDADSQGDASTNLLGEHINKIVKKNLYECMSQDYEELDIRDYIVDTQYENLDIVGYSTKLPRMDVMLASLNFKEEYFIKSLENLKKDNYYDFIIVDMDKNLGVFNTTILCGCDYIIIPAECSYFHIKGLAVMQEQVKVIRTHKKNFEILGVIANKADHRKAITKEALEQIDNIMPGYLFKTVLKVDSTVEKSQWAGEVLGEYNKSSRAYQAIQEVTTEILDRIKERKRL